MRTLKKKYRLPLIVSALFFLFTGCATHLSPAIPKGNLQATAVNYRLTKLLSQHSSETRKHLESEYRNLFTDQQSAPELEMTITCVERNSPGFFNFYLLAHLTLGFFPREYQVTEVCNARIIGPDRRLIHEASAHSTATLSSWGYLGLLPELYVRDWWAITPAEKRAEVAAASQVLEDLMHSETVIATKLRHRSSEGMSIARPTQGPVAGENEIIYSAIQPSSTSIESKLPIKIGNKVNFGNYHALVIGINNYPYIEALQTAKNDARSVAYLLKNDYGFKVKLMIDSTRSEIISALGELRQRLTGTDNVLIYYAGHGWLDEEADEGYWLPADSTLDNETNWISNSTITSSIRAMRAKHIMIVADSCYAGKLVRGVHIRRKTPGYLTRISQKVARLVLTSGGLEPVIDSGGDERHSVFASAFIKALRENHEVMDGSELFTKIRRQVMLNSDQTPEYSDIRKAGHDGGDFIFVVSKQENEPKIQ